MENEIKVGPIAFGTVFYGVGLVCMMSQMFGLCGNSVSQCEEAYGLIGLLLFLLGIIVVLWNLQHSRSLNKYHARAKLVSESAIVVSLVAGVAGFTAFSYGFLTPVAVMLVSAIVVAILHRLSRRHTELPQGDGILHLVYVNLAFAAIHAVVVGRIFYYLIHH